jgi:hypothetical protein
VLLLHPLATVLEPSQPSPLGVFAARPKQSLCVLLLTANLETPSTLLERQPAPVLLSLYRRTSIADAALVWTRVELQNPLLSQTGASNICRDRVSLACFLLPATQTQQTAPTRTILCHFTNANTARASRAIAVTSMLSGQYEAQMHIPRGWPSEEGAPR